MRRADLEEQGCWAYRLPGSSPLVHSQWLVQADIPIVVDGEVVGDWTSSWVLSTISLEDREGYAPAAREYPQAAYEFSVVQLDPTSPVTVEVFEQGAFPRWITPIHAVVQFGALSPDDVERLTAVAVRTFLRYGPEDQAFWDITIGRIAQYARGGPIDDIPSARA